MVVAVGSFLATHGTMIILVLLIGVIALLKWIERPSGRLVWDTVKLSVPIFGPLFQKLAISHFCRTLATLHAAGVSITNALELVAGSMNNVVMERVVKGCLRDVMEGQSITEPLRRSGVFTEMSITMLSAGEQAGAMDSMLHSLADYYESQVEIALKGLMSLIEPVIIVFVGISIGMIVIAMMLPILNLATLVM